MKLKVKEKFFDKREDKYVDPDKQEVIEREENRALELIRAGVCEECSAEPEKEPENESEAESQEEPTPKKKGTKKTKE